MRAERWRRLEEIFQSALDCPAQARAVLLDSTCSGDAELRNEVDSLLTAHEQGDFDCTRSTAFDDALRVLEQRAAHLQQGRRIGQYRLIRELGRGGMSRVYLAARADQAYDKQVAIKVVERGLDGEEVIERFQSERQILARLDHPNITRILDGGTTEDGLPFLVMDYVEGEPIDRYCEAAGLDVVGRLKLFQGVCAAVHYAHQNLIIHRDIKPGNVLVSPDGVPRLLDFGIAKLLPSEPQASAATRTLARRLTPEYASPEQLRGEALTTASDVYSLGVLLYRLLSGQSPYRARASSTTALEQAICEDQPERPSVTAARASPPPPPPGREGPAPGHTPAARQAAREKLCRSLRGDLDNIVLMALRKEPERRYASAGQLAEDIGRYLAKLPVIARADTAGYRMGKFLVRHRTGVGAAAVIALALIAGILGTWWQAGVARAERARAQRQFDDVRKLATSFLFEFNNSIQSLPGATPARRLLAQRALEYLSKLAQEAHRDAGLQRELSEAFLKVGDLQGNPYEPNIGDAGGAAESYRKALALSSALVQADASDLSARQYLARSYQSLGEVLPLLGATTEGINDLRTAAENFEQLVAAMPRDRDLRKRLADCYQALGDLQGHSGVRNLGDRSGALASYARGMALYDALAAADPGDQKARRGQAVLRLRIGDMQQSAGEWQAALQNYRAALDLTQSLAAADPGNERTLRVLAHSHRKLADLYQHRGELHEALQHAFKAADINQALAASDPGDAQVRLGLAMSLASVADLLSRSGQWRNALEKYQQARAILDELSAAAPPDLFLRAQLADALVAAGVVLARDDRPTEARVMTLRGLDIARELAARATATPDELSAYARMLLTCEPRDLRDPATAVRTAERAVQASAGRDLNSLEVLAQAYAQNSDTARAAETERRALALKSSPQP